LELLRWRSEFFTNFWGKRRRQVDVLLARAAELADLQNGSFLDSRKTIGLTLGRVLLYNLLFSPFSLTDKDVARTDREHPYFAGDSNPHLPQLRRILLCYVAHDPDLGLENCHFCIVADSSFEYTPKRIRARNERSAVATALGDR
jgi:hypothetical protein